MGIYRSFLLFLLFFARCVLLPAQSMDPARTQGGDLVERYTTENGLPSNGIKGLEWDDATGFLWIATEAGVTRYNGADFRIWSKSNTPGLLSERMLLLQKNRSGRIYAADESGSIFFVMQNSLQFLVHIRLDTRASTAKLIGLAASGPLFRQSADLPPGKFGYDCGMDVPLPASDSQILIYHNDATDGYASGLYDYRKGIREPAFLCPLQAGSRLFSLHGNLFVFDSRHAFSQVDPRAGRILPVRLGFDAALLKAPVEGEERLYWENGMDFPILIVGTRAWLLDYRNNALSARLITASVPTDVPIYFAQYVDKHGLLFLGTASKGLVVIRQRQVQTVKKERTYLIRNSAYYSQLALPNGSILTSQGHILGGPPPPPDLLPIKTPFDNYLYLAPDSVLWYSYGETIHGYSYRTRRTTEIKAGAGSITSGLIRSDGILYVANAIGIGCLRDHRIDYGYQYPRPDVNNDVPFAMMEWAPGQLLVATCQGLLRYDTHRQKVDTILSLPGTCVRALWKYKGYLFIGTYGRGIFLWKNEVMRPIPLDRNNYLRYAHCFLPDKLGYCWISSNKGLFRVKPEDLIGAYEKNTREVYYQYFGKDDGMDITEFNGGCTPCALTVRDSILSFPSMDGLVWVDPRKAAVPAPEGDLYIDDLFADSLRVNMASLAMPNLPSSTRELDFHLAFPAWGNKENLYIEYQLEPSSPGWKFFGAQGNPTLRLDNLAAGSYRLLIRRLTGGADHPPSVIEARFRIIAPWYQQAWAWLLALCCLSAVVMWIVRVRTRQLHARERKLQKEIEGKTRELQSKNIELERTDQIKTRLISIISHDLVTPLKFLHLAGKKLIEKKGEFPENLQIETIREMMNTAGELELLSTNILNWIKYRNEDRRMAREHFHVHQLTSQLFRIFNYMARQKGLELINRVDEGLVLYQFIEPVKIVLYNLILNGINFSQQGYIEVSSSTSPEAVCLTIRDTGVGMTPEQINNIMADRFIISSANVDNRKGNGLGYLIIKDLLKIIRGTLTIGSERGQGTIVLIRLPVYE
ncbi:MAG: HAMP domain-containing sensor histidine kinase [Bacteroidota bacterium]|nr:HAMP domain-containing sensor histidine kinase [Bacteroidota bacterium]